MPTRPTRRGRIVSFWFVSMLVLAGVSFTPSAAAAPTVSNANVVVVVDGKETTVGAPEKVRVNSTFMVKVYANATSTDPSDLCGAGATWVATADLSAFGSTFTTAETVADASPARTTLTGNGPIAVASFKVTNGAVDGADRTITVRVTAACPSGGTSASNAATSAPLFLDNVLPSLSANYETTPAPGKVGSSVTVKYSGVSGVKNWTTSLWQFDKPLENSTGLLAPGDRTFTAADTGISDPWGFINVSDDNGNVLRVTIKAASQHALDLDPPRVTASVGTIATGPSVPISLTGGSSDINSYQMIITPSGGAAMTLTPLSGGVTSYTLDRPKYSAMETATAYSLIVRPTDTAGNTRDYALSFTTLAEPAATVTTTLLSGNGGVGSTFRFDVVPGSGHDNGTITANLEQLISAPSDCVGNTDAITAVRFTHTLQCTVAATAADSVTTIPMAVQAPTQPSRTATVTVNNATGTSFPFDAKLPAAPATLEVFAINPAAASPQTGAVNVTFTKSADADAAWHHLVYRRDGESNDTTVNLSSSTRVTPVLNPPAGKIAYHVHGFEVDLLTFFHVRGVDEKANKGILFPAEGATTVRTTPRLNPLSVTINQVTGPQKALGAFTGVWISGDSISTGDSHLDLWVKNTADGTYWKGNGAGAASFGASPSYFDIINSADGTWTATNFTTGPNATHAPFIPNGTYEVGIRLLSGKPSVPDATATTTFILDYQPPVLKTTAGTNVITSDTTFVQQGTTEVKAAINVTDALTQISSVTLTLLTPALGAVTPFNGSTTYTCSVGGARCALEKPLTNNIDMNATFRIAGVPVGEYRLRATFTDEAGNAVTHTYPKTIVVVPRLEVVQSATSPVLYQGAINFTAYAGYDNTTSLIPGDNCAIRSVGPFLCKFSSLRIEGRNDGGAIQLLEQTLPDGTPVYRSGMWVWDHSPTNGKLALAGLDETKPMEVRLTAVVNTSHRDQSFSSPWIRVRTAGAVGGLNLFEPVADWSTNTTGDIRFNATVQAVLPASAPAFINAKITKLPSGTPSEIRLYPIKGGASHVPHALYSYTWNYTTLTDGEYRVDLLVNSNDTAEPLASTVRFFTVWKTPPTFVVPAGEQKQVYARGGNNWAGRTFDVFAYIDHGSANISAASIGASMQRTLRPPDTKAILVNGEEGFSVVVKNSSSNFAPASTLEYVNLTVTLPTSALGGDRFIVTFNVTNDGNANNTTRTMGATTYSFRLDDAQPTVGVLGPETNLTGTDMTTGGISTDFRIYTFSEDAGSGTSVVELKLRDISRDRTWVWNVPADGGGWVNGDHNSWATSNATALSNGQYLRNVRLLSATDIANGAERTVWEMVAANRLCYATATTTTPTTCATSVTAVGLDHTSLYEVSVRARDPQGLLSQTVTRNVRFDGVAPKLDEPAGVKSGLWGPTSVNWHGPGRFTVNVTDNYCIAQVNLLGLDPNGQAVGPAPFARKVAAACPDSGVKTEWVLDMQNAPSMTNIIGTYTYWFEAIDTSGHRTEIPVANRTFKAVVRDTTPATVATIGASPPTVPRGTSTKVLFDIVENQGLDTIEVLFGRINKDGSVTVLNSTTAAPYSDANVAPPAANGTGKWFVDTSAGPSGTREPGYLDAYLDTGLYTVIVRPRDIEWTNTCPAGCPQADTRINVTDAAEPVLIVESPTNLTAPVSAQPTLRFRVLHPNVATSGISVLVENETGAMVSQTVTTTPLTAAGNITGYTATYTPTEALNESRAFNVTLRVTTRDGLSNTTSLSLNVDATPPTLTRNVTGTIPHENATYATENTRIELVANDTLSGLASITYRINGGTSRTYTSPIVLGDSDADGAWDVTYTATDRAGNEATGNVSFLVDRTGPTITVSRDGDEIVLLVTDAGVGLNVTAVTVHYAYGADTVFRTEPAVKQAGNAFRALLPGNASATGLRYYVEALDELGNLGRKGTVSTPLRVLSDAEKPPGEGPGEPPVNAIPVVVIDAPTGGATVRGETQLRWRATDADGDALTVMLVLQKPGDAAGTTIRDNADAAGSFDLDLKNAAAGPYTFIVTASDGVATGRAQVTFTVSATKTVEPITTPPPNARSGASVLFSVRLNTGEKAVETATYLVLRDGVEFKRGTFIPEGGVYAASVTPTDAGKYEVSVVVNYADGSSEPPVTVASFNVAGEAVKDAVSTPAGFIVLIILAILTMSLAAGGAFWRWRK